MVKNLPAIWKTWVWPPGWEDLLVEGEVTPESLAGKWEAELPRRGSLLELGQDLRQASLAYIHSYSHLNWKRRALKEISLFLMDFLGGAVDKNPPAGAGDTVSIPGPGRSHMLWDY